VASLAERPAAAPLDRRGASSCRAGRGSRRTREEQAGV